MAQTQAPAAAQTAAQAGPPYPMASLYVGDLHWDVAEAQLFEKFSQCGSILSIRVCRDMTTRRSLGYAYVNFQNPQDAERALDTLNYEVIKGRPIRIMWSQRDPTLRRSGVGNIFIKNLDKCIDNKALYDTFSAFGNILSCKIATDETSQSKGFGFVHFDSEEAARMAIDKVNGMLLNGKKVYVGVFVPRKDRARHEGEKKFTNCYIKNLPEDVSDEDLRVTFEKFGSPLSVKVMTNDDGKTRCFGFVSFKEPEEAEKAVAELNNKEIVGSGGQKRVIQVFRAQKKSEREAELRDRFEKAREERQRKWQGVNLYVKNLDDDVDDVKLTAEFGKIGTVTSAKVMLDPATRKSRGFGFVCYSTPEEATRAITVMNGNSVFKKPLYVALAQRKEDRQAQLAAQYYQRMSNYRVQLTGGPSALAAPPGVSAQQAAAVYGAPTGLAPFYMPQQRMFMPSAAGMPLQPGGAGAAPARARFGAAGTPANAAMRGGPGGIAPFGGVTQAVSGVGLYQQGAPGMGQFPGMPVGAQAAFRGATSFAAGMLQNPAGQMGVPGAFGPRFGIRPGAPFTAPQAFGAGPSSQQQQQANQLMAQANAAGQRAITGTANQPSAGAAAFGSGPKGNAGPQRGGAQQPGTQGAALPNPGVQQQYARMPNTPMTRMATNLIPANMRVNPAAALMQQPFAIMPAVQPSATANQPLIAGVAAGAQQPSSAAEPLTAAILAHAAQADPGAAKQMLGERLYPVISEWHPQLAGKLTGMLLEMDNVELLHMLEAKDVLRAKVDEAFEVLKEHQRKEKESEATSGHAEVNA